MAVQEQTDHGTCSYLTFDVEPDSLEEDGGYCVTQQTLFKDPFKVELSFQNVFRRQLDHYPNQFSTQVCPKRSRSVV